MLRFRRTNFDEDLSWTDGRRVEHYVRVCCAVFLPVTGAVIADHLATRTPVVFDG